MDKKDRNISKRWKIAVAFNDGHVFEVDYDEFKSVGDLKPYLVCKQAKKSILESKQISKGLKK